MSEWIDEVLSRPPIRVLDDVEPEHIVAEMKERLEALMACHNGCEPTEDGWRRLALALALKHEPVFAIETPADRSGRSGAAGAQPTAKTLIYRAQMKAKMAEGLNPRQAALALARNSKVSARTLENAMSRKSKSRGIFGRQPYEIKAEKALILAAESMSQK